MCIDERKVGVIVGREGKGRKRSNLYFTYVDMFIYEIRNLMTGHAYCDLISPTMVVSANNSS